MAIGVHALPSRRELTALLVAGTLTVAPPLVRSSAASQAVVAPQGEPAAQPLLRDPEAQAHLDRGLERFYEKDFEGASTEFKAAYAIEPAGFLLYSWAQAERYAGDCTRAVELFTRFLAGDPPEQEAAKARERITECGGTVPEPVVEPERPFEPDPEPEPEPEPEPPQPTRSRRPGVIGGAAGLGVGLAVSIGGGMLVAVGRSQSGGAPEAASQQAFVDEFDAGRTKVRVGWGLVGAGAALAVTGAVVMIVALTRRRDGRQARRSIAPFRF